MVYDRQSLDVTMFAAPSGGPAVEWRISDAVVPYPQNADLAKMADNRAGVARLQSQDW